MAASLAYPDRRVVVATGDGAFGFNAMELDSAVRHRAGLLVVAANNGSWAIEVRDQQETHGQVVGTRLQFADNMYDLRAVIEGLACRKAAEINAQKASSKGPSLTRAGRKAVASGSASAMIAVDMAFHAFIYTLSENPLVARSMETHWTSAQRVMGEVLMRDEKPRDIWDQHEAMLEAIASGNGRKAEELARQHILQAANFMIQRLRKAPRSSGVKAAGG